MQHKDIQATGKRVDPARIHEICGTKPAL